MLISDQTVKAVKELSITDILHSEGIAFKKVGREATSLCPWHNDTNPSLTINNSKGFCYCFVCQQGGDGIGFVRQKFGLSFSDAIERIATKHNIECIYDNIDPEEALREAKAKAERLIKLNKEQESFRANIKSPECQFVRDILFERNISPAACRAFGLGYAKQGFFANRITVPIFDHRNVLVGFSGRATIDGQMPKYKNSENGEFFDKSRLVFNEYLASEYIKESNSVIFVEGYFDVISLWQSGFKNVVAMQGTAAPSLAIIKRLSHKTNQFILCYDSDEGGKKAIDQFIKIAGPLACDGEINISIAILPEGTDPDQCIKENKVNMSAIFGNAIPWIDWQLDQWCENIDKNNTSEFTKIESMIRGLIDKINSPALRQHYIDKASKLLSSSQKAAIKLSKEWGVKTLSLKHKKGWIAPSRETIRDAIERRLLRFYIHYPSSRPECEDLLNFIELPINAWLRERLFEIKDINGEIDLEVLKAILCSADQHYVRSLRPLLMPTIKMKQDLVILDHIRNYLISKND